MKGIYLIHPFGKYFANNEISAFVKSNNLSIENQELYLCSKKYAYGIIKINEKRAISPTEFIKLFPNHKIKEFYRMLWWGDKQLYYYPFEILKVFKEPILYNYKGNNRTSVIDIELKEEI